MARHFIENLPALTNCLATIVPYNQCFVEGGPPVNAQSKPACQHGVFNKTMVLLFQIWAPNQLLTCNPWWYCHGYNWAWFGFWNVNCRFPIEQGFSMVLCVKTCGIPIVFRTRCRWNRYLLDAALPRLWMTFSEHILVLIFVQASSAWCWLLLVFCTLLLHVSYFCFQVLLKKSYLHFFQVLFSFLFEVQGVVLVSGLNSFASWK